MPSVLNVSNGIPRTVPRMGKVLSVRESARECHSFFFFFFFFYRVNFCFTLHY